MKLDTRHFGMLEIEEDKIIEFIGGVPGFSGTRYVLMQNKDDETSPFTWLQSTTDGDIALLLLNPFILYPDYAPEIKDEYIEGLEHKNQDDLVVYNVVVLPEDVSQMTVNLKAPILINANKKKGMQVIAENVDYDIRHYLYEDIKRLNDAIGNGVDK